MRKGLAELLGSLYRFVVCGEYRAYIRLLFFYGGKPRLEEHFIKFLNYQIRVPDVPSFLCQFKDFFLEGIYRFASNNPQPVIYDCGANIGMAVFYYKWLYPQSKIKAFEPDSGISNILKENLSLNKITDVMIFNKAVWTRNGEIGFSPDGAEGGSIIRVPNSSRVACLRLRDHMAQEKEIDMLKMDIEGAEMEVLCDCEDVLNRVKNLFIEYHSWNFKEQNLDQLLSIFTRQGFRYYIQNVSFRVQPFINKNRDAEKDLQLNIIAYRHNSI